MIDVTCIVLAKYDRVFDVFAKSYLEVTDCPLIVIQHDELSQGIMDKYDMFHYIGEPSPFGVYAGWNRGIRLTAVDRDVVVMCDDIILHTACFMDKLKTVAYANEEIGLVVPLSGDVLDVVQAPIPLRQEAELIGHLPYVRTTMKISLELAYLKRPVINKVGLFDEGFRFHRGAPDYAKRCLQAGYRHGVCYATYIQHGGPAFGKNWGNTTGVLTNEDVAPDWEHWREKWGGRLVVLERVL